MNGPSPAPIYVMPWGGQQYERRGGGGGGGGGVILGIGLLGVLAVGGGAILWSTYGQVKAKITSVSLDKTSVDPGAAIATEIQWQNVGVKPHSFDVVAWFGDLEAMTGWGGLVKDVGSIPLQSFTTVVHATVPAGTAPGRYDVTGVICDATELESGGYRLDKVYGTITRRGLLLVKGGGGSLDIVSLVISKG